MTDDDKIDLLLDALCLDGGHHKQWYLEQVLLLIVGEDRLRALKEEWHWEDGIPP